MPTSLTSSPDIHRVRPQKARRSITSNVSSAGYWQAIPRSVQRLELAIRHLALTAGGLCLMTSVAWGQGQFLAPPTVIAPDRTQTAPSSTPSAAAIGQPPINVVGSSWVPMGPAPTENGQISNVAPNDRVIGAIQALAAHPTNPDILYLGSVNGGVWRTLNATASSPSWFPLTDTQGSQSIGALEFDPTDASGQTLVAGIGRTSSFGAVGGARTGLLRTTDGGFTWIPLGQSVFGNENITSAAGRGNIILAASDSTWGGGAGSGLFRSTDGGTTFQLVSGGSSGLPAGPVSDLVGDPGNPARLYTAVLRTGIFRSDDTGATWVNVTGTITGISASTTKIEMSAHNSAGNNVVYVAVSNSGQRTAVFRSANQGGAWTAMDTVDANIGGQAAVHFSIVADKTNPNMVYVGGDRIAASPFTGNLFRGDAALAAGSQWTSIVNNNADPDGGGPQPGTAPHADSREMVFDANGNIIQGDDGGIYRRSNPTASTGVWTSVIGNLQVTEIHDLAYDRNAKVLICGTQDNGTHVQRTPGSLVWDFISGGDGGDVAVDAESTPGFSIRYASSQNLGGFRRYTYDANNNFVSSVAPTVTVTGGGAALQPQFVTPVVLNAHNKTRLIIGGANSTYESLDQGNTIQEIGPGIPVNGTFNRDPVAYGGKADGVTNLAVLYVGSGNNVFVRTNAGGTLAVTTAGFPGGTVRDIVLDQNNWRTAYVADSSQVFTTSNTGASWNDITGNLPVSGLRALEFITTPTGDAVVVGSEKGVYISFVSSLGTWSLLGTGLPTVPVFELVYDPMDDVLFAGTFGRGAFKLNPSGGGGGGQLPSLRIDDATVTEPLSGTSNAVFTVTLSPSSSQTVTVNFATADSTATAGSDYAATNGSLSFAPGATAKTITVPVNSDVLAEGNETFLVNLSSPTNATLGKAQGAGIILNGEPPLITGFTPTNGPIGTTVTITGANFSPLAPGNTVYFGAVRATVLTATATNLTVPVPVGATYTPISVSVGGFTAFSATPFNVTFPNNNLLNASSFAGHVELGAGANTRSVVVGDFNNDGKPDLAAANFNSGTVSVLRNVGSIGTISAGSFATKIDLPAGSGPYVVTAGDLDGDGRLDLAVVNYNSGTVSLLRNTSTGGAISFAAKVDFSTGLNPRAVLIGDVDVDGLSDVIVANEGASRVSVFRNLATGGITTNSFAAKVDFIVGTSPSALAFGDIDGDGKPDLVIANGFNGPGGNSISILRNTSTRGSVNSSTFATRISFLTPAAPLSVAIGDLDLDGLPDIVTANSGNSSVSAFRNTTVAPGTITLAARVDFPSGSTTRTVAVGDMDGDGKPDLVVANETVSTVSVLQNTSITPTINFAAPVAFATAGNPFGVAVADLDRDFKPEMITANTSGSVSILRNQLKADPSVTWATPGTITYGTPLSSTQLNASAGVPGNFIYSPSIGTVLSAGANQVLSATFVPYESGTYNTKTVTTTITVNPVVLTVTPFNASRSYGVTNPVFTGTLAGLQNNDDITGVFTSAATSATPVGEYGTTHPNAIVATLTDPNSRLGNYNVTSANGTLTITNAPLTVNVNHASRAYGAADPAFSVSFIGLANNDPIGTLLFTTVDASASPGSYADSINVILSGDALSNYAITTVNPGTLTVNPAPLTITADNTNRTYGAANPVFTGTVSGLVGGDTATPTFDSAATPASSVGAYAITVSSLSGSALANYAVMINTGTLTISNAPLTVTPADTNRVFGAANPVFTGTVIGLQNDDAITPNYASAAAPPSPPGLYDITATLSDPTGKLTNYTVAINKGRLTITGGDAPIITLSSNVLNYVENAGPVILNGGATVADAGSPDFATGVLAVSFTAGGAGEDRLAIRHQGINTGQIGVSGTNVTLGGASIGTFTGGTDGSSPLLIALNTNATPPATQALLRNLTYENVSEDPATNARTVQIVLTDGDGGTSAPVTMTLNVAAVNDAPTVAWLAPTNNAALKAPGPFLLEATAADVDGIIQQVEFFAGTTSLGVATNAPYQITWTNVAVGSYTLRAVATDQGVPPLKGTNSPPIDISVNPGFNAAQVSTNGQFQLTLTGAQGIKYDVEISTDLISWLKIGEVTAGADATPFLDPQQISFIAQRFYRFKVHTP